MKRRRGRNVCEKQENKENGRIVVARAYRESHVG